VGDKPFERRGMRFLLEARNWEASRILALESYACPHLDKKSRALIDLVLSTIRPSERALRRALTKAVGGGAKRDEIIDAILAAHPIAGTENVTQATEWMLDWEAERHAQEPSRQAGEGEDGFLRAAALSDLTPGEPRTVRLGDRSVVLIRLEDGGVTALSNICPHSGGPLGEGRLEGNILTCPWHDWHFEITTGECINRGGKFAQVFPVKIEGNDVRVKIK
jgi:nitrite reductase/ring-hydroxylating ferredoxin subunit/alkylhydroperoxidase/carboxymuconolactone decarboxylase family protein YurZ